MKKLTVKEMAYIAVFTALICVVSQLSVPLPGGVPMTLQTLILPLAGVILGTFSGTFASVLYVLLGAVGLPVFAGWTGGFGVIMGTTGGFIVSFPLMTYLAGLGDKLGRKVQGGKEGSKAKYYTVLTIFLVLGSVINYIVGTVWCMVVAKASFIVAFGWCVTPFIPTAILKIILVAILGPVLRTALVRAHVLTPSGAVS